MEEPQRVQTIFLEQFPTEILEGIFIHLPQKDLASIATLSRRFSDIVEPFLYSEMHINLPGPACRFPGSDNIIMMPSPTAIIDTMGSSSASHSIPS